MDKNYNVVNGTSYNENTPKEVIRILENARVNKTRVRLFFGDTSSGQDWLEEYDTIGYVGRSCGEIKIPILLKNERSSGGGGILTHCIVRITIDKKDVYKNGKYVIPTLEVRENTDEYAKEYPFIVFSVDKNSLIARFSNEEKAKHYVAYLRGERNCK